MSGGKNISAAYVQRKEYISGGGLEERIYQWHMYGGNNISAAYVRRKEYISSEGLEEKIFMWYRVI